MTCLDENVFGFVVCKSTCHFYCNIVDQIRKFTVRFKYMESIELSPNR